MLTKETATEDQGVEGDEERTHVGPVEDVVSRQRGVGLQRGVVPVVVRRRHHLGLPMPHVP